MLSTVANDTYNFAIDNTQDTVLCPLARHYIGSTMEDSKQSKHD